MFNAIYLDKPDDKFNAGLRQLDDDDLERHAADGNVTVAIEYSTINYKDGLAICNRSPVVRKWPMVPGIDGAGTVLSSQDQRFKPGDRVVLNGWGVGESHWGCLAGKARLKADWLVALPSSLSTRHAMAIGTAGYTAMLSAMALVEAGVQTQAGEILVTGAAGGVGSVAVAILSGWGYKVVASTGRTAEADYLRSLGAAEVIDRATLAAPGRPLQKERWAGVVDCVGSHTLVNACAQTRYGGVVTACGLAQGMDFPASVAPFILRGVRLVGIDSVMCPMPRRTAAWQKLASDLDLRKLDTMSQTVPLASAITVAADILDGKVRGRTIVETQR